jgi:hypothetical protein
MCGLSAAHPFLSVDQAYAPLPRPFDGGVVALGLPPRKFCSMLAGTDLHSLTITL